MTHEEMIAEVQRIGQLESIIDVRNTLVTLQNNLTDTFDQVDTLTARNNSLQSENDKLRDYNNQLFLKVGFTGKDGGSHDDEPAEKRKFADLFDDKGALK